MAIGLALFVAATAIAISPFAGIPMNDDWSYARTAQALAEHGRIVYNGWSSPMVLPQAAYGAVLIKLFGFSYRMLAMSGIAAGALCAVLLFYLCRACGVARRTSVICSAVAVLNPISLGLMPSFMTELPSLAMLLGALLALVRSIRTNADGVNELAPGLFALSVALGVIAGSNRQNLWGAYFGSLVVLFILLPGERKKTLAACAITVVCAIGLSYWFSHQPYAASPRLSQVGHALLKSPFETISGAYKLANIVCLLGLPVTLLSWRSMSWKSPWLLGLLIAALAGAWTSDPYWNFGNNTDYMTVSGTQIGEIYGHFEANRDLSLWISSFVRMFAAGVMACNLYLLGKWLRDRLRTPRRDRVALAGALLLGAFAFQLAAIMPWFSLYTAFDRYVVLLLPCAIVPVAVCGIGVEASKRMKSLSFASLGLIWATSVLFAWGYMRYTDARATAYHFLLNLGIPRDRIDAGIELNCDTQVAVGGYIENPIVLNRPKTQEAHSHFFVRDNYTPVIRADYLLSAVPQVTNEQVRSEVLQRFRYPAVFPPFTRDIYVLRIHGPSDERNEQDN